MDMSTHVVTIQKARPDKVDDVVAILTQALPDSLAHDGCEAIHLRRDQDDPTRIVSFTQWATRQHYGEYLAWRTETGLTDEVADMLTEPMSIEYFDDIVSLTH
jgi:quinol monooxygenase YgiN